VFWYVAITWLVLTDPSGGQVFVNGDMLSSLREIHVDTTGQYRLLQQGEGGGRHCLLGMGNGRFVAVMETCAQIKEKMP
jgi:hypothetical protein